MKCPKCNEEINTLINTESGEMEYSLSIDCQGDIEWSQINFYGVDSNEFVCPKCGQMLFANQEDAIAFLKGE